MENINKKEYEEPQFQCKVLKLFNYLIIHNPEWKVLKKLKDAFDLYAFG
jgi:hypothetical protein